MGVLCLLVFPLASAKALNWQDIKQSVRPFVVKTFGKEKARNWLGSKAAEVTLPPIPQVTEQATSTELYAGSKKEKEAHRKMDGEKEKQYNYAFINDLYESVINEKPNRDDVARWMNAMGQGASREGVYRGLVLGKTYKGMENYTDNANQKVAKFVEKYSEKFLNRPIKAKELQQTNFFKVKRLTAERTLEVLDALMKKDDHFERWYAVFSGEMAKKFSSIWDNKIRRDDSEKKHLQWAKKVPVQHVKSEVIIKLHRAMNSLME